MTNALDVTIKADPAKLAYMRSRTRRFLRQRVPAETGEDILLSLDEACKNAIRFGRTPVEIHLRFVDEGLCMRVIDGGEGFDVTALGHDCPNPLEQSGRGLYLIHALMDEVTIVCGPGTTVSMLKRLAARGSRSAAA